MPRCNVAICIICDPGRTENQTCVVYAVCRIKIGSDRRDGERERPAWSCLDDDDDDDAVAAAASFLFQVGRAVTRRLVIYSAPEPSWALEIRFCYNISR